MKSILVATDNKEAAVIIQEELGREYRIETAGDRQSCLEKFKSRRHEFSFIDVRYLQTESLNGVRSFEAGLEPYRQAFPSALIVVMAETEHARHAVCAVKAGAGDYLCYPLDRFEVRHVVESLAEQLKIASELRYLREKDWRTGTRLVERTTSPLMEDVLEKVTLVAPTRTTVLLNGETGTGKSLMAKLIHSRSNRSNGPFVSVHCGAIPENLVESELFGHEKGAFTGATRRKLGKFQIADKGTIFLDEIGTISPVVQIKLLQVLQENRFSRVGGETTVEVDVRVIAASNTDLKQLCQQGVFRQDLYYRLNGFIVELPALRHRTEDIPQLALSFIENHNLNNNNEISGIHPEVMEALQRYSWPGNIRELENLVGRACILEKTACLGPSSFPEDIFDSPAVASANGRGGWLNLADMRRQALEDAERDYLARLLTRCQGKMSRAALMAEVTPRHLRNMLKKYGLHKEEFK